MIIAVWIASGLLALANLLSGSMKLFSPKPKLEENMNWVRHVNLPQLRFIAAVEALGAIGLILPVLLGILPILTPLAAVGLGIIQAAAVVFHIRLGEGSKIGMNIVLFALAVFVAVARFAGV